MREYYLKENDFQNEIDTKVMPLLKEKRSDGFIDGYDGNKLHFVKYIADKEKKAVVFCHGFTESSEKFHELTYYLLLNNYSVYILEHRGHGYSYRELEDFTLTHINKFDEYVEDFKLFLDYVKNDTGSEIDLFAHSMGGGITLLYLQKYKDSRINKVFLSSPMIMPDGGKTPIFLARIIIGFCCLIGKKKKRAFISEEYKGYELFENCCKTSEARFDEYEKIKRSDKHFQNYSPTYAWVYNSINIQKGILNKRTKLIKNPIFLAIAENDELVLRKPQLKLAKKLPDCKMRIYENAKHEVYDSHDDVAYEFFDDLLDFLK